MKPIVITFSKGTQFPPKLGTLILKPTAEGKAAYTQNIDVSSDEYGNSAVVPGPALSAVTNNAQLTGVPVFHQFFGRAISSPEGTLYFAQGELGTKTVIRRIQNVASGSTPSIDTGWSLTIDHGAGHANQEITDIVARDVSDHVYVYITIKDDSDTALYKIDTNDGSPSLSLVTALGTFTGGLTKPLLVFSTFDNNIYWIRKTTVSSISTGDAYTAAALALGLPNNSHATAAADWQQQLEVAYSTEQFPDFTRRQSGGSSGIVLWDYFSPGIIRNVMAPCRYISALIPTPDGQLLVFGGVDEGKSSIYTFTGYGFNLVTRYIGDLPRSRHAVEFDGQGRIIWLTADGFLCRYDRTSGIFENLGRTYSTGGMLVKGIGSPTGNDFFVGVGQGSTYELDIVSFGSYSGDNNGADGTSTPMAVSGTEILPPQTSIGSATLNLTKPLESGEKVVLRIYKNGSTTDYVDYLTMDYSVDGAISSKREVLTLDNINSFNAAVVYKMNSGSSTAPPVSSVVIDPESTFN